VVYISSLFAWFLSVIDLAVEISMITEAKVFLDNDSDLRINIYFNLVKSIIGIIKTLYQLINEIRSVESVK
jgi:hypothetical protein